MLKKIIFIFIISLIICRKYPIIENIEKTKKGKPRLKYVESSQSYLDIVENNDNVVTYYYSDYCDECEDFLPILEEASRYKILNKKWLFLKIDCSRNHNDCLYLGVEQYPHSEVFRNKESIYVELPTDLVPLLEILYKLSTDPIVRVNSKEEFFKNYGYYSPIVEIEKKKEVQEKEKKDENEKKEEKKVDEKEDESENKEEKELENDFMDCITRIANEDFVQTYYFGVIEAKDYKEKIVFDNNNFPVTYYWDGVCDNAIKFLNDNKYPLMSVVDKYYLKQFDEEYEPPILITLMTFPKNQKINNFITSFYTKLAYENQKYAFGYVDYTEDKDVFSYYFTVELNHTNEIQFLINDFVDRSYYIHKPVFNIDNQTEKEIINEMKKLLLNITNLTFETGSKFQDIINYLGLNRMNTFKLIMVIIVLILILIVLVHFCGAPEDEFLEDEYEYEEETETSGKVKTV